MALKAIGVLGCGVGLAVASVAAGQPRAEFIELPASFRAAAISGDGRTVVGYEDSPHGVLAGFWTRERGVVQLPGGGYAEGANHDGTVIVGISDVGGCRWVNGGPPEPLGTLPGQPYSWARAVSADGTVIAGTSGPRAFRWTPQEGIQALPRDHLVWDEWQPRDVSADGQTIVGMAYYNPGQRSGAIQWPRTGGMRTLFGFTTSAFQEDAFAVTQDGAMTVGWGQKPGGQFGITNFAAVWPENGNPPRDLGADNPSVNSSIAFDVTDTGTMLIATARTQARVLIGTAHTPQTGFFLIEQTLVESFGLAPGTFQGWRFVKVCGNSTAFLLEREGDFRAAVVHWPGYCEADCELDGTLDIFDYLCFQNKWAAQDAYACGFDTATGPGVCDVFDFIEFASLFSRGMCER